jgi:hypothetical protein
MVGETSPITYCFLTYIEDRELVAWHKDLGPLCSKEEGFKRVQTLINTCDTIISAVIYSMGTMEDVWVMENDFLCDISGIFCQNHTALDSLGGNY